MGEYFLTIAEKLKSKIPNLPKVFDTGSESFKEYYIAKGVVPKSAFEDESYQTQSRRKETEMQNCVFNGQK